MVDITVSGPGTSYKSIFLFLMFLITYVFFIINLLKVSNHGL